MTQNKHSRRCDWQWFSILLNFRLTAVRNPSFIITNLLILHDSACPHQGEILTHLLSKYEWEVLPHAPYSPDKSPPDFNLFPKLKAHAWTQFFLPGRGFCSGYPSHPKNEQKWHPKWNNKSSETLGHGHWETGELHGRNVMKYFLK
jgi:hypothetical protein